MKRFRGGDVLLAVLVLLITAMLVVPLPTILLDFLLVINLSFSVIVLLVGLYMPNSLALLSFPTILLLTTLFRLSLNVASSRLILSQGDAGTVIHAFGTFLIRGEILVGIVIFTIVTIVNFIVISKGAARVSEVAARFVLDALPGKQATIESELRSGLITAEEARTSREELRKESQLFGAMDGSMRFVQGDAIAGLCIIATNIFGGLYRGLSQDMNLIDAMQTYTILTVGDGLVSQIPALLISVCAGIVVTRVSSSPTSTLGTELGEQLFSKPGTIVASGVILALAGLLPGIPALPFVSVGLFIAAVGWWLSVQPVSRKTQFDAPTNTLLLPSPSAQKGITRGVEGDEIVLFLDTASLHRVYRIQSGRWISIVQQARDELYNESGLFLPEIRVSSAEDLTASSYRLEFNGSLICQETLPLDALLLEIHPDSAPLLGIDILKVASHPIDTSSVIWAYQTPFLRRVLEAGQIQSYDIFQYILLKTKSHLQANPEDLVSSVYIYNELKNIEQKFPGLLTEAFQRHFLSVSRLTELCVELVKEGISLKEFRPIVEAVAGYCGQYGISSSDDRDVSIPDIVDHIRIARRKQVLTKLYTSTNCIKIFSLESAVEEQFRESEIDQRGSTVSMNPDTARNLRRIFENAVEPILAHGMPKVCILCAADVRHRISVFLRQCRLPLKTITIDEVDMNTRLERIATLGV